MSVKERLIEFIRYKDISNSEFCRSIEVSTAFVTSMVKSIQPEKIERITLKYPELNIEWLLIGKGEMIKPVISTSIDDFIHIPRSVFEVIKKQANSLEHKDRQIDELISMLKKTNVQEDDAAGCADASGM